MALTTNQHDYLFTVLGAVEEHGKKLNNWETGFMENQRESYEEHGENMLLSVKQWQCIDRIAFKVGVDKDDFS